MKVAFRWQVRPSKIAPRKDGQDGCAGKGIPNAAFDLGF